VSWITDDWRLKLLALGLAVLMLGVAGALIARGISSTSAPSSTHVFQGSVPQAHQLSKRPAKAETPGRNAQVPPAVNDRRYR